MKRTLIALALAVGSLAVAQPARADSSWSLGFNIGIGSGLYSGYNVYPAYCDPVYYAPAYPVHTVVYDYAPVRYYDVPTYYSYPYGSTAIYRSYYGYPSYAFYPSFNFSYNYGSGHYRNRHYPGYRAPVYNNYNFYGNYNNNRDRDWDRNDRGRDNGNWNRDRNDQGNRDNGNAYGDRNNRDSNAGNREFSDYQRSQFSDPGLKYSRSLQDMQDRNSGSRPAPSVATSQRDVQPARESGNRMMPITGVRGADVKVDRGPVSKGIDGDRASRSQVFAPPSRERVQQAPVMRNVPQPRDSGSRQMFSNGGGNAQPRAASRPSGGGGSSRSSGGGGGGIDGR